MSDKERSGGHSAKSTKTPPNPGRDMHPNAAMGHQAATKSDPTRKAGGKGK
jgi:hypothetical protein